MFLIWGNLDIVRPNCGLVLVRIVESLDVAQITDIESCNVIRGCQSEIEEAAVLANIGAIVKGRVISISLGESSEWTAY